MIPLPLPIPFDFGKWLWDAIREAIRADGADVGALISRFILSTTDVLAGGRFTESEAIRHFEPAALAVADAALVAIVVWASYHVMFAHGMRSLYTVRLLLPRALLAILLAHFAMPLMQGGIDLNNALCDVVVGIGTGFNPAAALTVTDLGTGPTLGLFVTAVLFCGYGVFAVAYVVRYSLLIVLAITAPLAAILFVLPDTHHYARRWGSLFVSTLLMQPLQLLILEVGLQLESGGIRVNPLRHFFALASLLIAFKVPGALHATSTAGTHALSLAKHYAHVFTHPARAH